MKHKTIKVVAASALTAGVALTSFGMSTTASAVDYNTNVVVEFDINDQITKPVDPTDPAKTPEDGKGPLDPTKPGGPTEGTPGPLSIDYASSFDFGKQKISSTDEVYWAAPQKFGDESRGDGPNYVQVTDNRGTEAGWTLKVKQQGQFLSEQDKKELTGAQLVFDNATVDTASVSARPSAPKTFTLTPDQDGVAEPIMAAQAGQGSGTYVLRFGDDANAGDSVSLKVPGSTTKYKDKYSTTLLWTLEDTPGSL
ncbi:WxL domain-containing protein [Listeria kieliensis]|uniref:Cell surface protein n=1 Tax=Listeria kieliensis TaxID=1621700 RepID=A0A3D8TRE7_9LIST|nr:WxL domain-containing protein [Listeria kieliensis]RDX01191.1 cell surface protein [Listeria kieliensis]